jgi:hypothetical protein
VPWRERVSLVSRFLLGGMIICALPPNAHAQSSTSQDTPSDIVHRAAPSVPLRDLLPKLKDGDAVIFAPGTYRDCAVWTKNNLLLRAETP